jgi:CO/xanthine dehydrogenase Mo-binding subunit
MAGSNAQGAGPSFGTHMVDARSNPETGRVTIFALHDAQDAGRAVPELRGKASIRRRGTGHRLGAQRGVHLRGGRQVQNAGFLDYRMPVASDVPMIDAIIVEVRTRAIRTA